MLTVISDTHLTDGTSGQTINHKAFDIFRQQVAGLAEKRKASTFELVLLGDIFDLIRSEKWIATDVRPWNEKSKEQSSVVMDILTDILEQNKPALAILRGLLDDIGNQNQCRKATLTYMMGNHDWLINRYPSARQAVGQALGLTGNAPFQWMPLVRRDHRVVMRHGDRYDEYNYMEEEGRDSSSFGDAIVIELLDRFPWKCATALGLPKEHPTIQRLRDIDNVRPYGAIPAWVMSVTDRMKDGEAQKVRKAFIDLFEEFVNNKFVQRFETWNPFDIVDKMEAVLVLVRATGARLTLLQQFGAMVPTEEGEPLKDRYVKGARKDLSQNRDVNYVVFGHTHRYRLLPLNRRAVSGQDNEEIIYFNTGTWRKRFERATINPHSHEFVSHHVMTHTSFYSGADGTDRNYEVWHGGLGE
ncbi:MAG: hypothetical protein ACE5JO_05885 [Candidatus Binatia bacterium]